MKRKVKTLAMSLFETTQKKFPEIKFMNIQEHPEQADRFWINVTGDMDEDREMVMSKFVARKAMKILVEEGYSFAIMLETQPEAAQ
jgi:hypothetical protein